MFLITNFIMIRHWLQWRTYEVSNIRINCSDLWWWVIILIKTWGVYFKMLFCWFVWISLESRVMTKLMSWLNIQSSDCFIISLPQIPYKNALNLLVIRTQSFSLNRILTLKKISKPYITENYHNKEMSWELYIFSIIS